MATARVIAFALAQRHDSPFFARRHLAVVPNVSWGLLNWEADLLVLQRNGFLTEVEIKISLQDWKADAAKAKWTDQQFKRLVKRFWYAVPADLAERRAEAGIPDHAGVIAWRREGNRESLNIVRLPKSNRDALACTIEEQQKLMRLGCLKAWKMAHHPSIEEMMPEVEDAEKDRLDA